MKLWLDDIRPCPDGYTHARSVTEAIRFLEEHDCEYASLDHDLGDYGEDGGDGFRARALEFSRAAAGPSEASVFTAPTCRG